MVYVCIPARDEERTIGVLLWKVRKVMAEFGRDYEVLVLDDASTDRTAEVLERYRRSLPLTVLRSSERLGYARAMDRLLREAERRAPYPKRDCVVTLQGDFTEDPADLVQLVKTLEGGADIVAGHVEGRLDGAAPRGLRFARKVAPWVLGGVHDRAPVSDPLCGFRVYRVIVLKKALREMDGEAGERPITSALAQWAANVELLGALSPHARRIEEAPTSLRYDRQVRESRLRPLKTLRDLLRLRGAGWFRDEPGRAA